jgi:ferredoxin--NADP+ reductase
MKLIDDNLNRIIEKEALAESVTKMLIHHPFIAQSAKPGQFVIVVPQPESERIPLTLAGVDRENGSVTVIFQEVGTTTKKLGALKTGDKVAHLVGPLGKPVEIEKYGRVILITGGVGSAFVYWMAQAFAKKGNQVWAIMGARTANLLILEKEMSSICEKLFITTDDGSKGVKGFVTDVLKQILTAGVKFDLALCAGPVPMMKKVAEITRDASIKTIASLNPLMVDGTGMCGGCRVTVGGKVKFACVEGPDFDAHQVDFDELMKRVNFYRKHEECSLDRYLKSLKS